MAGQLPLAFPRTSPCSLLDVSAETAFPKVTQPGGECKSPRASGVRTPLQQQSLLTSQCGEDVCLSWISVPFMWLPTWCSANKMKWPLRPFGKGKANSFVLWPGGGTSFELPWEMLHIVLMRFPVVCVSAHVRVRVCWQLRS